MNDEINLSVNAVNAAQFIETMRAPAFTASLSQAFADAAPRAKKIPLAAARHADVIMVTLTKGAAGEKKPPRFTMNAHSGAIMPHWWFDQLAIDLSGIRFASQTLPVLLQHDTSARVGWTDRIAVESTGLAVDGTFLEVSEAGRQVLAEAEAGMPWQASVMLEATNIEEVKANSSAVVNGQIMHGPGVIFRGSKLREVSFVVLGADENTSAELLGKELEVPMSKPIEQPAATTSNSAGTTVPLVTLNAQPAPAAPAPAAPAPANPAEVPADARAALLTAERARVREITRLARAGQESIRDRAIADGTAVELAAVQLLEDLGAKFDRAMNLGSMAASAAPAVGEAGGADAAKTPDEKWARMSDDARANYGNQKKIFLHFEEKEKMEREAVR